MRQNQAMDWAFAVQSSLTTEVKKQFRNDLHRWPLLRSFAAEAFEWSNG